MSPADRNGEAHLYAQEYPHDEAYLLANREGLASVRDAIDIALGSASGAARAELFAADGEGYALLVLRAGPADLGHAELPYTADDARDPRPGAVHPAALVLRVDPNLSGLPGPEPS